MSGSLLREDWEAALDRRRRLYFDPGRSRLFEGDMCYDFSWFGSLGEARRWCELQEVEFIDTTLSRLPESVRTIVLAARCAASPPFREQDPRGSVGGAALLPSRILALRLRPAEGQGIPFSLWGGWRDYSHAAMGKS